jgi:hypothetical protein
METQESQTNPVSYKNQLPNSSGILAMGIISLVSLCCCIPSGIVGLTLGIVALVLGNKALSEYSQNPGLYTEQSYKNTKAGRICGIIGICFGGLWFLGLIIYISIMGFVFGSIFSFFPWHSLGI